MRFLCQDIGELHRGDHYAERLRLDLERFAEMNKEEQVRAVEVALEETKLWPEVQQAFRDAFALYQQHKHGEPPIISK